MLYTKPYALNPNSILSRRETPVMTIWSSCSARPCRLPKGFFYEEILNRDFPLIKLHLVKNVDESMRAVIFGKADAVRGRTSASSIISYDRELMTPFDPFR